MDTGASSQTSDSASIVVAMPLSEEPGLGTLTIAGYLRDVTERFGEREALAMHTDSGVERWTYATLWERSIEVARALTTCGIGKDDRVGILMRNRPEQLAAAFGTALAGGVVVMLSTFSTRPELAYLLEASSISTLLFERHIAKRDFAALLREIEPAIETAEPGRLVSTRFPFLRRIAMLDSAEASAGKDAIETWSDFLGHARTTPASLVEARAETVKPADIGALFFSSGTTSLPKGILHSQRAIAIQWWRWSRLLSFEDDVRSWTANAFFWSGNFSMVVGSTFSTGGTLVLQPTFQPEEALELIRTERVTFAHAWPHQWAKLEAASNWDTADLSSLRYVGEATPAVHHPTVKTIWHEPLAFGTTETLTVNSSFTSITPPEVAGESHGEPLPGNTLKIVDPLTGAIVPRGVRGEIAIKGPTLMLGYVGIPNDQTLDTEGFFHTGDGGYLDELGRLFWEGRLSDIIKTGGANVSPREIDAVLATHPGVKLAQTVGVPHDTLGEIVVSCIIAHDAAVIEEATIRNFAGEQLASYKVPRRVLFFRDEELAMTGSDKVTVGALRELVTARLAGSETGSADR